jgi:hypothetical protein
MDTETAPARPDTPATLAPLSLAAAASVSGVSAVTLRKHLAAERLPGVKVAGGAHGATWQIDPADLAAFIGERYGRPIDLAGLTGEPIEKSGPTTAIDLATAKAEHDAALVARAVEAEHAREVAEAAAAELRARLDATLEDLGRYRALVEKTDAADSRVEGMMTARIAELTIERDAALAKLSRGWWRRHFGGSG